MAVDTAAKRASALAGLNKPYLRLVIPDGSIDRPAAAGMYNGFAAGPDVTAPTVSSATIGSSGTTLTIAFNESVTFGAGGNTGFTVSLAGGAATLTYSSGSGTSELVYTLSRTITRNDTGTLAYTQPGNGVEDGAGNDLVSFSGQAITNSSTQNTAPSDIQLSNSSVLTTGGTNAVVGSFSTTDPDYGDTFTYSLVVGTGDTNNASFNISGSSLRCNDPNALGAGTYSVRVQTSDGALTFAKAFTIDVLTASAASGLIRRVERSLIRTINRPMAV